MRTIQAVGPVILLVSLALGAGPAALAQTPAPTSPPASPPPKEKPAVKKPAAAKQSDAKPGAAPTNTVPGTNLKYVTEADWGKCAPANIVSTSQAASPPSSGGSIILLCVKDGVSSAKIARIK